MASLATLVASEASLLQEAAIALPHSFDKCTHSEGAIRQAVHLCLTCAVPRGLCSACSVACHGDHEQIELFPKRAFICDCPTRVGGTNCTLYKGPVLGNEGNKYGQNFFARFCRCGRPYDAKRERETMVQCVVCEDWYHESCLNLRTRPADQRATPDPPAVELDDAQEVDSTASNDLPPSLLPSTAYESLICGACVLANDTLKAWAGTNGVMMVVRSDGNDEVAPIEDGGVDPRWKVLDGDGGTVETVVDIVTDGREGKRPRDEGEAGVDQDRATKKSRIDDSPDTGTSSTAEPPVPTTNVLPLCLAPPPNPIAQCVINGLSANASERKTEIGSKAEGETAAGDLFLKEGWRERWCRCPKCLPALKPYPYLLDEEQTYEPPEDPDSGISLEELGMRALQNLPRDRAIDGIRAYNAMRDELMTYLRPFAQEGRVVREEDVREFFDAKAQATKS